MDISGTLASVLWKDREPLEATPLEQPESLKDFAARLAREERGAREAALAEMRKMLDWRFVHFAEEFREQLSKLGAGQGCAKEQPRPAAGRAEMEQRLATAQKGASASGEECTDGLADEPRLHLLEGKFAIAEHRLAEVQRWTKALEEGFGEEQSRLAEAEAWLAHLDRRVSDTEGLLGGRRGAARATASRLATVERLTIDGRSRESLQTQPSERSGPPTRSGGGSSGSGFSGGASSTPLDAVDLPMGSLYGKDRGWACSPSTKVSTNYATPTSQQSLTPSSPATLRHQGSR